VRDENAYGNIAPNKNMEINHGFVISIFFIGLID
jgi:hypothetical protein